MRRLTAWFGTAVAWRWLPTVIVVLGVVARVGWLAAAPAGTVAMGEITNVAIAFAKTGTLADAFRPGQGPTAHVLPGPPVYAGLVYREFGIRSWTSEAILAAVSISVALASFVVLFAVFAAAGTPRWARLAALAFAAVLPLNFALEAVSFRIWEGGIVTLLALLYLLALVRLDRRAVISLPVVALLAAGAAVIAFASPAFGLGVYTATAILLAERLPWCRWPIALGLAAAMLALLIAPWAVRNATAVGSPVLLRSNAGLEFALANHPAAVAPGNERAVFRARLKEIHPFESPSAYAAMRQAGGEVAYARALGARAGAWVAAHPADFTRLSLRHLRQYFFPPAWQWEIYSDAGSGVGAKQALHWTVTALGCVGALVAVVAAPRRYRYIAILLFLPALPYVVVQPILRYRYIMYGLTVFFAADLIARLVARFMPRTMTAATRPSASRSA